jgi:rhamnulokinase
MQAIATGLVESLAEARQIVRNSFELKEYQPENTAVWLQQYQARAK